ncbi:hypothetical protein [Sphingomonas sp.]
MNTDERERAKAERLAAALRANLRRRKQGVPRDTAPSTPIPVADRSE